MFIDTSQIKIFRGKCEDGLAELEDNSVQLVLTSPPYNVGKEYEDTQTLEAYLDWQSSIIEECYRVLSPAGSICWQVGNSIEKEKGSTEVIPLDCIFYPVFKDLGFKLRNRIVWTFSHGLHCSNRFSGRHETILWWSKSDDFTYNLDPVRVPQKYPGKKYYKGPKKGQLSGNPLGANPGDHWLCSAEEGFKPVSFSMQTHTVRVSVEEFKNTLDFILSTIPQIANACSFETSRLYKSNTAMHTQLERDCSEHFFGSANREPNTFASMGESYATITIKKASNEISIEFGRNRWVITVDTLISGDTYFDETFEHCFAVNTKIIPIPAFILMNWSGACKLGSNIVDQLDVFRREAYSKLSVVPDRNASIRDNQTQNVGRVFSNRIEICLIEGMLSIAYFLSNSVSTESFVMHGAEPLAMMQTGTVFDRTSFPFLRSFSVGDSSPININQVETSSVSSPSSIASCAHVPSDDLISTIETTHFRAPLFVDVMDMYYGQNGSIPSDVWSIPNVKHNHVEKTSHPCQFPVELAGSLMLALSNKGDMVIDPFAGSCTTGVAAAIHERQCVCMELYEPYADEGQKRLSLLKSGSLKVRSNKWKGS